MIDHASRLLAAVQAVVPGVTDLSIGVVGQSATVAVRPSNLQASAQATINAFDWSAGAQTSWENLQARALGVALLSDPAATFKLLRAAFDVTRDEINLLRAQVVGVGSAVWDPASIASGAGLNSPNVTVTGAVFGDDVRVMAPYSLQGLTATGSLVSANTITARLENQTGAAVNLASGTWNFVVLRYNAMPARTLSQFKTAITNRVNDGTVDT